MTYRVSYAPEVIETLEHLLTRTRLTLRYGDAMDELERTLRDTGLANCRMHEGAAVLSHDLLTYVAEYAEAETEVVVTGVGVLWS